MKSKIIYIILGLLLLALFLNIPKINAQSIDNMQITFEKEYYEVDRDNTIDITYTLKNNNDEPIDVYLYAECKDDLRCNYSKQLRINAFSSITDVVLVTGRDYGTESLKLHVLDPENQEQTKEFLQTINISRDNERGDFRINLDSRNFCVGKSNEAILEIDNRHRSGIYNIDFIPTFSDIKIRDANPKHYSYGEQEVLLDVVVNKEQNLLTTDKTIVRIESNNSLIIKEIDFYFTDCETPSIEFSVSRPTYESVILNKNEEKSIVYNVYNNSDFTKKIYISEQSDLETSVTIPKREVTINPRSSKEVEIILFSETNVSSGNYDATISFFDGFNSVDKTLRILLSPEYKLDARMLQQGNVALKIGAFTELTLVLENNGDISEDFDIFTSVGNNIVTNISTETIRVNPNKVGYVTIRLSSGPNTQINTTELVVRVIGRNSNFSKTFNLNVNAFRDTPPVTINILSIPREIEIVSGKEVEFEILLENYYSEDLYLDRIEIRNLSENITYELPTQIMISSLEQVTIPGKIIAQDVPTQEIDAQIVFISREGGQVSRTLTIKVVEENNLEEEKEPTMSSFLTLANSFLLGIILICFIVVMLYATKVIKQK
jgi:hypothetical protein